MKKYTKPYYGPNNYFSVIKFFSAGILGLITFMFLLQHKEIKSYIAYFILFISILFIANGLRIVNFVFAGRFKHIGRIISKVNWTGNENVLDVGVGKGILAISVAKKLKNGSGKVIGIDIWDSEDIMDNTKYYVNQNIELEGVADKVKIKTQNASALSFKNETFDVIVSKQCIHNIEDKQERKMAIEEMLRVLKTGGKLIISDSMYIDEYEKILLDKGLKVNISSKYFLDTYPASSILEVTKK
ncbi:methyltransferase domain-containing protein [Clostridium sporogenes]|uniref:class I SAM-dependent methyltransferase n=1 Tax=Clostridium botulinum TaxID=1491 RepID=UPI0007178765|nr:class I SAM-dependent methyltransferase [Clostridium botulinum]KRU24233.1 methyltransferase domain-containing protein [Clostridium sporogenes]KRU26176.1 methyltransferase domain-containing protein [Clostridium sporogenes]KRU27232.1 methyltransferase domain-containing protein [Clostridium sporogenes]KRU49092.1 methyltransferase domain-containing protein [Clostridium sporogenes]MBZ1328757.1 class I SAM-dependent methyltransferase [Clostridium botulinum]